MDISNNTIHNLDEIMYYYQRNIRDYMDNIHEYNNNINSYFNIIRSNPYSREYISTAPLRTQPNANPLFRNLQQHREEGVVFTQRFEDVVVRPTNSQINQALENYLYLPGTEMHTCPITLEPVQEGDEVCRIRHCGHIFKKVAIMGWFERNVRCPVCRYDIRDYRPDRDYTPTAQSHGHTVEQSHDHIGEQSHDLDNEFDDLVREFAQEGLATAATTAATRRQRYSSTNVLQNTLTNAIRSFVNQELQRLPVNDATTELLYTFDIPLTLDLSGNYRL